MELNKRTVRTIALLAAGCILLYWALQNHKALMDLINWVTGLLRPFLIGGAIAFILNVPMRAFEKLLPAKMKPGRRRALAMLLVLVAVVAVVALVLGLVIPQLGTTVTQIGNQLPLFWASAQQWVSDLMDTYPDLAAALNDTIGDMTAINWQDAVKKATEWITTGGVAILGGTINAASGVMSGVFDFFVSFCFAVYILAQKERLGTQARMLLYAFVPRPRADRVVDVAGLAHRTFSKFISGQCTEAVILGSLFAVAMTLCRMPYVLLISVLIAFTALIPIFGAFIGCGVGTFLILVDDPIQALWFVVLFLCLQQIEGNLIYPRVVGSSVGLPSIWVLAAVTVGGSLMGIAGMLVMIPLASVCYSLLRANTHARLRSRGIDYRTLFPGSGKPGPAPAAQQEEKK